MEFIREAYIPGHNLSFLSLSLSSLARASFRIKKVMVPAKSPTWTGVEWSGKEGVRKPGFRFL